MDPSIWGTKLWGVLGELVRQAHGTELILLLESLQFVLPCRYCRESYQHYLVEYPPALYEDRMVDWLWEIHECVNRKLGKSTDQQSVLTLEKFRKRTVQWTTFCSAWDVWDVSFSLAANLCPDDSHEKRLMYYIFYWALTAVCRNVPLLSSLSPYLSTDRWTESTLDHFADHLQIQQELWMADIGCLALLPLARTTSMNILLSGPNQHLYHGNIDTQ